MQHHFAHGHGVACLLFFKALQLSLKDLQGNPRSMNILLMVEMTKSKSELFCRAFL